MDINSSKAMVKLTASLINIQASLRDETSVRRESSEEDERKDSEGGDGRKKGTSQIIKLPEYRLKRESLSKREKREKRKGEKKEKRAEWKEREKKDSANNVSNPSQDA